MATEAQLVGALRQADAAGDRAGAARIAAMIQAQRGSSAPAGAGYLRDVAGRTDANINALNGAIGRVVAHPDFTAAPKILGAVGNYAMNAMGIPLAAGVDRLTEPVVRTVNNAMGTKFDPHYVSDQLINAGGVLAGGAPEALAALKESAAIRGARAGLEGAEAAGGSGAARPRPPPTVAHAQPAPASPPPASPRPTVARALSGGAAAGPPPASVTSLTPVESSALTKFTRVAKPDVNAMSGKAAAYSEAGIAPTLVDTTGRRGQGIVRALATRATPAQDAVEQFAEGRRVALGSRIGDQARNIVSFEQDPVALAKDVADARSAQANEEFGPVRDQPVQITPEMQQAIESPYGQDAIREAMKRPMDPNERAAFGALLVADGREPTILERMQRDVNQSGGVGTAPGPKTPAGSLKPTAKLTIGQAQDISDVLFSRANAAAADPTKARQISRVGEAIRGSSATSNNNFLGARSQSPDYEKALDNFAQASTVEQAPSVGASGLSADKFDFARDVNALRAVPPLQTEIGAADGKQVFDPIDLAKGGFARAIAKAAGDKRIGAAPGVAQYVADVPDQQERNAMLLGPDDAKRLQDNLRLERQAVINASSASPGAGSNTFLNLMNQGAAMGGEVSADDVAKTTASALSVAHGNPIPAALQALGMYLKNTRAFSDAEAEALANMAIDPSKHDDALNFIAGRAGPQAAEDLAPVMQQAAGIPQPTGPAAVSAALAAGNAMNPPGGQQPGN